MVLALHALRAYKALFVGTIVTRIQVKAFLKKIDVTSIFEHKALFQSSLWLFVILVSYLFFPAYKFDKKSSEQPHSLSCK